MKKILTSVCLALVMMTGVAAAGQQPAPAKPAPTGASEAASIAGNWTFALSAPQGDIALGATLKLDGKKLTGSITGPTGEATALDGEFAAGKATFSITVDGGTVISFVTTMKDADHLTGSISTPAGELPMTGTRVK